MQDEKDGTPTTATSTAIPPSEAGDDDTTALAAKRAKTAASTATKAARLPPSQNQPSPQLQPSTATLTAKNTLSRGYAFWAKLGNPRYVCAPMVLQSETAFRRLVTDKGGCDLAYTPMMHAEHFQEQRFSYEEHLSDILKDHAAKRSYPLFAQFCTTSPSAFLAAAKLVQPYVDAVDLNLGCPQRTAEREGFGAFLMDKPDLVRDIVASAAESLDIPVTCKIRVFPDYEKTKAFALMLQEAGCAVLAVHARTREQRHHQGTPRYDQVARLVKDLDIPVIVNGAVDSLQKADSLRASTGVVAAMAAGGLLNNPLMFTSHKKSTTELELKEALETAHLYLDYAEIYPPPTPRYIRDHLKTMLRPWLSDKKQMDLHNMITRNPYVASVEQYRLCLDILAHRHEIPPKSRGASSDVPTLHDIKLLHGKQKHKFHNHNSLNERRKFDPEADTTTATESAAIPHLK